MKAPKCPLTEEWIKKRWYIYTIKYYSAIEKNEIVPFAATWMDLECHTESSKPDREGEIAYDNLCMWNVKTNGNR